MRTGELEELKQKLGAQAQILKAEEADRRNAVKLVRLAWIAKAHTDKVVHGDRCSFAHQLALC